MIEATKTDGLKQADRLDVRALHVKQADLFRTTWSGPRWRRRRDEYLIMPHTSTNTQKYTHSLSFSLSMSLSFSRSRSLVFSLAHSHTRTHAYTHTHTHTYTHIHSHTNANTYSPTSSCRESTAASGSAHGAQNPVHTRRTLHGLCEKIQNFQHGADCRRAKGLEGGYQNQIRESCYHFYRAREEALVSWYTIRPISTPSLPSSPRSPFSPPERGLAD